ncbi:MAG: sigma-70 family RNA polymerase sigma factor [Alphaproteobacteria bacterium]|nr:MAG: sigma-70 family RNA polymerase sigma factor [Alphaproteobacteria bacterium]
MDDELGLARRAAAGDAAAFAALVRTHEAAVRRFLARLTRGANSSGGGADDLAQEVFLKAWRSAAAFRGEGSYRAWLMRIAWTLFLSAQRAKGRREAREQAAPEPGRHDDRNTAIDLQRALAGLGERERAASLLCFGEGCSHGEAARIMGIPLGTLKSILARARAALVQRLEA